MTNDRNTIENRTEHTDTYTLQTHKHTLVSGYTEVALPTDTVLSQLKIPSTSLFFTHTHTHCLVPM